MSGGTANDDHRGDDRGDDREDDTRAVGDAVDDALAAELKRQRARFVQAYLGVDRAEGVGRGEEHWNESLRREAGGDGSTA